ncbi:unnamed protein product [Pieris macdunnoughi]|uniref:Uncharacterized protein n=1 Tax=Pieris macdunnoughi TaxID=345717 RepID=A0A821Y1G2_9NEOP|nr:unnamed protein product [Pieris macdunnoughi]
MIIVGGAVSRHRLRITEPETRRVSQPPAAPYHASLLAEEFTKIILDPFTVKIKGKRWKISFMYNEENIMLLARYGELLVR